MHAGMAEFGAPMCGTMGTKLAGHVRLMKTRCYMLQWLCQQYTVLPQCSQCCIATTAA